MTHFGRLFVCAAAVWAAAAIGEPRSRTAKLPLGFEIDHGPLAGRVEFVSRGPGYTIALASGGALLSVGGSPMLKMQLAGAAKAPQSEALERLNGVSNYLLGSDPRKWRTRVPRYAQVRYTQVYPGVDMVYHGDQGGLEYDFIVARGADPRQIRLAFDGMDDLRIDASGDLVLRTSAGEMRQHRPAAYQELGGTRKPVTADYVLKARHTVGLRLGPYDPSQTLVIDPTLAYSSYLGGSGLDVGNGIALDSGSNVYIVGQTNSTDFPPPNANRIGSGGGFDVFVTKLDPTGALVYSTYLGGSGSDNGLAITVDSNGSAYVTGTTASTDFPTVNATQPVFGGSSDAFVAELDPSGATLIFSTYLGGSLADSGNGIALDPSGNIDVGGETFSMDFPLVNPLQAASGGISDIFVAQLAPGGSAVNYATYLGGSGADRADAITTDSTGNVYLTGRTGSRDFPVTANAVEPTYHEPGDYDAYVAEIDPLGMTLVFSTYLGGSGNDQGFAITVDSAGSIYAAGGSASDDFATPGAFQTFNAGNADAFVAKIDATPSLVFATLLGGGGRDHAHGIGVDSAGNSYIAGRTGSMDFWIQSPIQAMYGGGDWDGFAAKLDPTGSNLLFSTYFGGSGTDRGFAMALDPAGTIYVTGDTNSPNFPVGGNPAQTAFGGGQSDAFVTIISDLGGLAPAGPARRAK